MYEPYTVCFFGHRIVPLDRDMEQRLESVIRNVLHENSDVEFLVGRDGAFDLLVASTIQRVRHEWGGLCYLTCVLPYSRAEFRDNEQAFFNYYDSVEICEVSQDAHPKAAITTRNRAMIERADLVVVYVDRAEGGAYRAMQTALKLGKPVINVRDLQ